MAVQSGREVVTVRVPMDVARAIDLYAAGLRATGSTATRSDAVRRLLDLALAAEARR